MLQSDETILNILLKAKNDGNELLKHFKIGYPSKQIVQESNSIFIASVDTENTDSGLDYLAFRDLVEVLIVTKNREYEEAVKIIKTVSKEIIRLINENETLFERRPVIRNITPEYNRDFVLTRGHIRIQVYNSESIDSEEEYRDCVNILAEDTEIILK